MPMHDWPLVPAGIYHHFHNAWITQISDWLNGGALPADCYAVGEQRAGDIGPDVLTLRSVEMSTEPASASSGRNVECEGDTSVAVAEAAPQVETVEELCTDLRFYASRQRQISIRHVTDDELIAIIEIISPANKHARRDVERFVEKATQSVCQEIHLMILDLFPPSGSNPHGIHFEIARSMGRDDNEPVLTPQRDRCLSSYDAGQLKAYVEPLAVSQPLTQMPLFLRAGRYINVDLEETYGRAFRFFPARFKQVLEGTS